MCNRSAASNMEHSQGTSLVCAVCVSVYVFYVVRVVSTLVAQLVAWPQQTSNSVGRAAWCECPTFCTAILVAVRAPFCCVWRCRSVIAYKAIILRSLSWSPDRLRSTKRRSHTRVAIIYPMPAVTRVSLFIADPKALVGSSSHPLEHFRNLVLPVERLVFVPLCMFVLSWLTFEINIYNACLVHIFVTTALHVCLSSLTPSGMWLPRSWSPVFTGRRVTFGRAG